MSTSRALFVFLSLFRACNASGKWQVGLRLQLVVLRHVSIGAHAHTQAQAHTCTAVARLAVLHYCHVDFLRSASVSVSFLPLSLFSLLLLCPLGVCCVCVLCAGCVLSYPCVHACGECCNVLVQTSRTLSSPVAGSIQLPSFPSAHARQAARNCSCLSSLSSPSCSPFSGSHLASCCCSCCCCYCCCTLCCFQFCLLLFSHFFASLFNKCLVHSAYAMLTAGSAMLFLLRF